MPTAAEAEAFGSTARPLEEFEAQQVTKFDTVSLLKRAMTEFENETRHLKAEARAKAEAQKEQAIQAIEDDVLCKIEGIETSRKKPKGNLVEETTPV